MKNLLCLSLAILSVSWIARADSWQAGTAKRVITPQQPMWMAGYGARNKPAEGTHHDIYARAVALQAAKGERAIIVSTDLLGLSRSIYDNVTKEAGARFDLRQDQIMINSSHTHCGPVLRQALYDIYPLDEEQLRRVEKYSGWLEKTLVELIGDAIKKMEPVTVESGQGMCDFAVNRRNNSEGKVAEIRKQGGVLDGPVDHSVPVLAVHRKNGTLMAVVFGYACHNTTLSFYEWCGDYAGFAQYDLEKRYPGATALFYMGCGADQNPIPRRTVELCQSYGERLSESVAKVLEGSLKPLKPTLQTQLKFVTLNLGTEPSTERLMELAKSRSAYIQRWAQRLLKQREDKKEFARTYSYPIQAWRIGGTQVWVTLGGEVVVDYSLRIKKEFGDDVWVAGYCNDVMAYIPSLRVLREGGYEGNTSMMVYGQPAERWAEDVEEIIMSTVTDLLK